MSTAKEEFFLHDKTTKCVYYIRGSGNGVWIKNSPRPYIIIGTNIETLYANNI